MFRARVWSRLRTTVSCSLMKPPSFKGQFSRRSVSLLNLERFSSAEQQAWQGFQQSFSWSWRQTRALAASFQAMGGPVCARRLPGLPISQNSLGHS
jgi:hypothetical protein